jgi:uncharacterized membrane protein
MSKKKNKFKKSKRHHLQDQPIKKQMSAVEVKNNSPIVESSASDKVIEAPLDHYDTQKYDYVKHDIKKILIIMVSIIIVLFAFYFIELKTTILDTIGNWIYKILNIQTL